MYPEYYDYAVEIKSIHFDALIFFDPKMEATVQKPIMWIYESGSIVVKNVNHVFAPQE